MEEKEIAEKIAARFPNTEFHPAGDNSNHAFLVVPARMLPEICRYLKEDEELQFQTIACLSGVDRGETLTSVYHLFSYTRKHYFVLKVHVSKESPRIPTVEDIWPGAGWFERESYDLLGIVYEGNSDLRRIMLPEDWVGHPLRKDYQEQEEYRGMGTGRNSPLQMG